MALADRFQAAVSGLTARAWYVRHLASALDFRVLGPLEVFDGERQLALGGTRQRSVLAILLLRLGETVSSDRLIDELWGERPPADAQTALQQHVSRLRKALEPHDVLVTRAPGYALDVDGEQLDLERFRRLHELGRRELDDGKPTQAADTLRDALALWRGPPLADLQNEHCVRDSAVALEDERIAALETQIDADLGCGRHAELVPEIVSLVKAYPLRERLRGQLMLALYRSGRQSEALEAYGDARQTLVSELGLEPAPELQALQQAILTHDESLRSPLAPAAPGRRRWIGLAATAFTAAVLTAALAAFVLKDGDTAGASAATGEGLVVGIDAESGEVTRRIPAGRTPSAVAVGGGALWLVDADARTVLRIVPSSRVVETLATGATPTDIAFGAGSVWVANGRRLRDTQFIGPVATAVARLDPTTRTERATTRLPRAGGSTSNLIDNHLAISAHALWAVAPDFSVVRVDATTGAITETVRSVPAAAVATGPAGVWVVGVDGAVVRLDERSGRVVRRASIPPGSVGSIAVGRNAAWVTVPTDGTLWRIGAGRAESVGATELAPGISDVAVAPTGVWVTNSIAGTLTHVDPETTRVLRTIDLEGIPRSLAIDGDTVWVTAMPDAIAAVESDAIGVATFAPSACERPVVGENGPADFLITSDLPLQGGDRLSATQMAHAIAFVLRERGFRAGPYRLAYQSCDDSIASRGLYDEAKCASNARAYGENPDVIGVVGTFNSACAVAALPELNRAPDGPLAMVSPLNSFVGLTRQGPGFDRSLPAALYPTGVRNYVRVFPTDDLEGAALALLARDRRRTRVVVLDDGDPGYGALQATAFETAAGRLGLEVVARTSWNPQADDYAALARRVADSRAAAVYVGGLIDTNAGGVIRDLRRRLSDDVDLLGPSGLAPVALLVRKSDGAARGMYLSIAGVLSEGLPPAASRWVTRFGETQQGVRVEPSAVYAAQATEVLLDAIARSDGTRRSVVDELFRTRVADGLLGSFGFDANGDVSETPMTIVQVRNGGSADTVQSVKGAPVVRVVRPSPGLVASSE
ncbi:MAG TPA: BTAD domain-containing putative transcriptional regulator [Gaiellaceae bacterium]|nr:BTAD domain-containing putative transcriptional regulator [Gaiellaceae bacterium]